MRKLSELEGVSLGIVYRMQPCTAYRVRRELQDAPSSHWRASAGSVYPLLARLEGEGLIEAEADKADGRGRMLLKMTAPGRHALKAWITGGAEQDLVSSVPDPVRSRTFFLDVLSKRQRKRYLETLIKQMEAYLSVIAADLEPGFEADDLFDYLGSLGAVRVTEARLDWLKMVRARIEA